MWNQIYDPLNSKALSTIAAALPVVTLLVLIASGKVKAHIAALIALIVANLVTIFVYSMPAGMSVKASLLGVVVGFFPIGWIVLNVIFLYRVTVETGRFELLKRAVGGVTEDRRLEVLLIAFAFGAFFEGRQIELDLNGLRFLARRRQGIAHGGEVPRATAVQRQASQCPREIGRRSQRRAKPDRRLSIRHHPGPRVLPSGDAGRIRKRCRQP